MQNDHTDERQKAIEAIPRAQRERLAFIDFQLYFLGELGRNNLKERFETGSAGATRDIALYKEVAPENLELDKKAKLYRPTEAFSPVFVHDPRRVLTALTRGFGQGIGLEPQPMVRCEYPQPLNMPSVSVIAPIARAIYLGKAVRLHYTSVNSGRTVKELVPLAMVDVGLHWQVRAFDRKHQQFRDFVLTRMEAPQVLMNDPVSKAEMIDGDTLWNRIIELELVPHPDHPKPEIVKTDYAMKDGVLKVPVRAAHAGYMLRHWSVDCSTDHHLYHIGCALWLRDALSLYGSEADVAPGYEDPRPGHVNKIRAM